MAEVFKRTPLIADLQPGGKYLARDLNVIGGVPVVLKALLEGSFLHGDALTLSGRSLVEELAGHPGADGRIVRDCGAPIHASGRVVVLKGAKREFNRRLQGRQSSGPARLP